MTAIRQNLRRPARAVAWGALLALATAAWSQPLSLSYNGSLLYSTGNYLFAQRTRSLFLYSGISASYDRIGLSISAPAVWQNSPWISLAGAGMIPSGGSQHDSVRQARHEGNKEPLSLADTTKYDQFGLGDPVAHADVQLLKEGLIGPSIKITGDVKIPVATESHGFGTGQWDYALGLSLAKSIRSMFIFLDASYWKLGDLPDLDFHDPVVYSIALGHAFSAGRYALLLGLAGATRMQDDVDPPMQVNGAFNFKMSDRANVFFNIGAGLTESAPDFAGGVGWHIKL